MKFINISSGLKMAFGDDNFKFELTEQIQLTESKEIEILFGRSLVYLFHDKNSSVLNICRSIKLSRKDFYNKVNGTWEISNEPISVSAIILNEKSSKHAREIKIILKGWLKPVFP